MPPTQPQAADPALYAAVERLLADYALCLDRQDFERWPTFFTEDASYCVQQAEDVERGLLVGLMVDCNHARLRDRVRFMNEIWKGSIEPYRTRHFHQLLVLEPADGDDWTAESNLLVTYTMAEHPSAVLASGRSIDTVTFADGDTPRLRRRHVVLDGVPARALNYPL